MKFCILSLLCFTVYVTASQLKYKEADAIKRISRECIGSSGVDVDLVKRVKGGDIVDDPKVKEFISCVLQKLGLQNSDGSFKTDVIKSKLPVGLTEEEKSNVMNKCLSSSGDNVADTAWRAYKCYRESSRLNLSDNL